jgi:hypothetical protein
VIKSNLNTVINKLTAKLTILQDKEYLLRPVVTELIPMMTERIHQDGKDSTGEQIGTYSEGYMKVRTGQFRSAPRKTKGADKGEIRNAGTYSRGKNKGKARPQYHRSNDTKVVVSLTRQLENDWAVKATPKGYGIGFLNSHNADKAGWVEETYDKKIFKLSKAEEEFAVTRFNQLVQDALHT